MLEAWPVAVAVLGLLVWDGWRRYLGRAAEAVEVRLNELEEGARAALAGSSASAAASTRHNVRFEELAKLVGGAQDRIEKLEAERAALVQEMSQVRKIAGNLSAASLTGRKRMAR